MNSTESPTTFWEAFNANSIRPIDRLINASRREQNPNTPKDTADFVLGCQTIYHMARQIRPDVIILPLRGAAPIGWVLDEFEQRDGILLPKIFLRIGDHYNIPTNRQSGYPWFIKQEVVNTDLDIFSKTTVGSPNNPGVIKRPLLIDEVQAGSTLNTVANNLSVALKKEFDCDTLYIIGAQDTRALHRIKTDDYREIIANTNPRFITSTVNLPLFYIDKNDFLDFLLDSTEVHDDRSPRMLHTMHNEQSEAMFRSITTAVLNPDLLLLALNAINSNKVPEDPGTPILKDLLFMLHLWIKTQLSESQEYYLKAQNDEIIKFLEGLVT